MREQIFWNAPGGGIFCPTCSHGDRVEASPSDTGHCYDHGVYGPCEELGKTYNLTPLWLRTSSTLVNVVFTGILWLKTESGAIRRCCIEADGKLTKGICWG